jgi:hypothetical protein
LSEIPATGQGQARPGNKNAEGHAPKNPNPAWYDAARKHFTAGMRSVEYRESYKLHEGAWYAGDTPVNVSMPRDWRKIGDPARPVRVRANGEETWHRNHAEARATASLATKKIHDAARAERLKANPLDDPRLRTALYRALENL